MEQCLLKESQKDFTSEWLDALWLWTCQFAEMILSITIALSMGLFGLIISALWILHCFFEGVDSDFRTYQAQLKQRDGLELDERDGLLLTHKSK